MPHEEAIRAHGVELPSYEVDDRYYTVCPKCSHLRKPQHRKLKVLHVTIEPDKFYGGCNHCGWTFPEKGFRESQARGFPAAAASGNSNSKGTIRSYGPDLQKVFNPPGRTPKCYWQHRANGQWVNGRGPHDIANLLYRLEEAQEGIKRGQPILIVEGEKDVDTCYRFGFFATCNSSGASQPGKRPKWTKAHSAQLRHAHLVVFNDNDDAGYAHAVAVVACSQGLAASIRRVDLKDEWPSIGPGEDITDWAATGGHTLDDLKFLIANAKPVAAPTPVTPVTPVTASGPSWLAQCIMSDARLPRPLPIVANVIIGLKQDDAFVGKLSFDEMAQKSVLRNSLGRFVSDDDVTDIQTVLQQRGLKQLSMAITAQAIDSVARDHPFHPIRNYLDALTWDGVERIDEWLPTYFGAENSEYTRAIGRMFLISMVARVYQPGCKCDYMLILEGPQGEGKSMACRALASDAFFSDHLPDLANAKDVSIHLAGKWLIEVPELHAFSKAEATLLKSFLSRQRELFRPPYGKMEVEHPRQCVFIGTSNKDAYLRDETGGRRFWPVKCGTILVENLNTDRDHLFAEAVWRYRAGEPWRPTPEFERQHIRPEQAARYESDIWTEKLEEYLAGVMPGERVTVRALAKDALFIEDKLMDARTEKRIVSVLQSLGWTRSKSMSTRYWIKPLGH